MNLPNALTVLRIFLVPVLVVVLLTRAEGGLFLGAGIFGLAVLTDYLDGYFARRRNQITRLGILLDPILRNVAAGRGVLIPASPLGKGKMVSQVTAIFMLLLSRPFPVLGGPAQLVLWVVVGLTVLSGVDYFWRFGRGILRGSPPPEPGPASLRPPVEARLK